MSSTNISGLKKRLTYNEIVDYIEKDPDKIKYPDRWAKQIRNSFELSQLDGEGMREMENQQINQMKEQEKENILRTLAKNTNTPHVNLNSFMNNLVTHSNVNQMLNRETQTSMPEPTMEVDATGPPTMLVDDHEQAIQQLRDQAEMQVLSAQHHAENRAKENASYLRDELAGYTQQEQQQMSQLREDLRQSEDRELVKAGQMASLVQEFNSAYAQEHEASALRARKHEAEIENVKKDKLRQLTGKLKGHESTLQDTAPKTKAKASAGPSAPLQLTMGSSSSSSNQPASSNQLASSSNQLATSSNQPKPEPKPRGRPTTTRADTGGTAEKRTSSVKAIKEATPEPAPDTGSAKERSSSVGARPSSKSLQLTPSQMGIQRLTEEFNTTSNKQKLSTQDLSAALILLDEWKAAKGQPDVKKEKLKALQGLYKRTLYKK